MKLKLITAMLMTVAAIAWLAAALIAPADADTLKRWIVVVVFAGFSVFYWSGYFRMKKSTSGTE